jgi:DNA mismatch repair protein MutL
MPIRRLPPETVNRIAAGEVVERPASAVKELVENALDAGALKIAIEADGGGLSRILIADDGSGMGPDDLTLAVERHATSKLSPQADGSWDLLNISTMGFRGEALPSIGSVARLTISSRPRGADDAYAILVEGGATGAPGPSAFAGPHGARVEVRDLFYATPARLKFMKSERAEQMAITEEVKRQAMAHEATAFSLDLDGRRVLRLPAEPPGPEGRLARLAAVLGREFQRNAKGSASAASPACRPTTGATPPTSICSSTAARCATACCRAPCAPPMPTTWPATATRPPPSISSSNRPWSTSTSTPPRPRSASATLPWCAA